MVIDLDDMIFLGFDLHVRVIHKCATNWFLITPRQHVSTCIFHLIHVITTEPFDIKDACRAKFEINFPILTVWSEPPLFVWVINGVYFIPKTNRKASLKTDLSFLSGTRYYPRLGRMRPDTCQYLPLLATHYLQQLGFYGNNIENDLFAPPYNLMIVFKG